VSKALLSWIVAQGIGTALIEPGKPWQNGEHEVVGPDLVWPARRLRPWPYDRNAMRKGRVTEEQMGSRAGVSGGQAVSDAGAVGECAVAQTCLGVERLSSRNSPRG